jgi:hypothetical protein
MELSNSDMRGKWMENLVYKACHIGGGLTMLRFTFRYIQPTWLCDFWVNVAVCATFGQK